MSTGTMTSKGQITIPKDVRVALGLTTGVVVSFDQNDAGEYVLRPTRTTAADLAGILQHSGPALSISDMEDAIARAAQDQ
ncbi:AbrB/MazE/SpoVT family DNA-binding domain-containing protein [Ornithinimicrobium sp. Y1847]|uniref:AbrB/MazE/SpoVT family DNA-binding domain-containing protein n=1 Tax=unclassified Ornithinimicrobium TaxID=2615080 RepID=UPI003B6780E9